MLVSQLFTSVKLDNTGPLTYSSPLIDVVADRVTRLDGLTLTTKDVDITFPYGFESFLNNMTEAIIGRDSCYDVGLSGYHMNPLHWGSNANKVSFHSIISVIMIKFTFLQICEKCTSQEQLILIICFLDAYLT